jgi:putative transcriptional regulator
VTIVRKSNEAIRAAKGQIDFEKLDSATEEDIDRWKREDGIDDAALGPPRYVRAGPDVRLVRERLGLSQEAFAARFRLSLRTVQEWEQRRRVPEGPARVLLQVIEREPEAAARALASPPASADATR